jgi:hypothetical protein
MAVCILLINILLVYGIKHPAMKCTLQKSTNDYAEYRFTETGVNDTVIKYNGNHHSVRLHSQAEHGFFYVEQQHGILKSKMVFKNAYGTEVGKMLIDHGTHCYTLRLDGFDYICCLDNNEKEINITQHQHKKIINSCSLELAELNTLFAGKHLNEETASLILAGCWSLNVAIQEERKLQYN